MFFCPGGPELTGGIRPPAPLNITGPAMFLVGHIKVSGVKEFWLELPPHLIVGIHIIKYLVPANSAKVFCSVGLSPSSYVSSSKVLRSQQTLWRTSWSHSMAEWLLHHHNMEVSMIQSVESLCCFMAWRMWLKIPENLQDSAAARWSYGLTTMWWCSSGSPGAGVWLMWDPRGVDT